MTVPKPTYEELEAKLADAVQIIESIKEGQTDAVVSGDHVRVFRLREAEAALRESEARFRVMADGLPLSIWVHDADGRQMFVNQTFCEFFGVTREEMIGDQWKMLLHPKDADAYESAFLSCMQTRLPFNAETRVKDGKGRLRWIESWARPRWSEIGEFLGYVGASADITDRKHIEEALKHLNDTLEERVARRTAEAQTQTDRLRALARKLSRAEQRERKRLAKTLHDGVQPTIVAARMQLWEIKRKNDRHRPRIEKVENMLQEALTTLRSLSVELSPPPLQLKGLISGLNWLTENMAEKHQLTVNLLVEEEAEPAEENIRFLLFECVRELLLNIVKHAGTSEADAVVTRIPGDLIQISISDQGGGFDPGRLKNQPSDKMTFGLFNIQERLASIGGFMEIVSAPGQGTRSTLTAPIGEPKTDGTPDEKTDKAMQVLGKESMIRILIVDDHKVLRDGLKGMFRFESDIEAAGEAADGLRAVELADALQPDVVIMDINLGENMDGVEATRRITSRHPNIKVIGLSMHMDKDAAEAMRKAGASAYLTKSRSSEEIIDAVRACATEG